MVLDYKKKRTQEATSNARGSISPQSKSEDLENVLITLKKEVQEIQDIGRNQIPTILHSDSVLLREDKSRYDQGAQINRVFGIVELDRVIRGLRKGELALIYGSPGDGKSTLAEHIAVVNAYFTGHDVLYVSLEMSEEKVREDLSIIFANQLLLNHKMFGFDGEFTSVPRIDALAFDKRELTESQYRYFFEVAMPFLEKKTKAGEFGTIQIIAPKLGMDVIDLTAMIDFELAEHDVDLLVIDYIALLDAVRTNRGVDWTTALGQIIRDIKRYALRRNLPIISPWQVNRQGRREAERESEASGDAKGYNLFVGSQSSEAEKSADVVVSIFRDDDCKNEKRAMLSLLKNRRGPTIEVPFSVNFWPEYKLFTDDDEEGTGFTPEDAKDLLNESGP